MMTWTMTEVMLILLGTWKCRFNSDSAGPVLKKRSNVRFRGDDSRHRSDFFVFNVDTVVLKFAEVY